MSIDPIDNAIDNAIADYRRALATAAPLDARELDELVDHLRELIAQRRGSGRPVDVAISEARLRLGDARDIARECARIRSGFAARLSPMRAWSAAVLLLGLAIVTLLEWSPGDLDRHPMVTVAIGSTLVVALVGGRSWARALLFGHAAASAIWTVFPWASIFGDPMFRTFSVVLLGKVGVAVLLAPWRQGEVTRRGWVLALSTIAFTFASGFGAGSPLGLFALIGSALAVLGAVLRARWACVLSVAVAVALGMLATGVMRDFAANGMDLGWLISTWSTDPLDAAVYCLYVVTIYGSAVVALLAAILGWPLARRGFGDPGGLAA